MRAGAAGLEVTDLFRLDGVAHVEDQKPFGKRLAVDAAPSRGDSLQSGDHLAVGDLNLNRPGVLRSGNVGAKLRRRRIGDVEHAPAAVPQVRDVQIPAAIDFLHRQLECRFIV